MLRGHSSQVQPQNPRRRLHVIERERERERAIQTDVSTLLFNDCNRQSERWRGTNWWHLLLRHWHLLEFSPRSNSSCFRCPQCRLFSSCFYLTTREGWITSHHNVVYWALSQEIFKNFKLNYEYCSKHTYITKYTLVFGKCLISPYISLVHSHKCW